MSDVSAQRGPGKAKDRSGDPGGSSKPDRPAAPKAGGLVSVEWFPKPAAPSHAGVLGTVIRVLVGAAAGGVLFALGHRKIAIVAWAIAFVVGAISLASPRARDAILGALAKLGRAVGTGVGNVLLTLVYFVAITPARFVKRIVGSDELHLRDDRAPSYYEPCDAEVRKIRYVRTMFATEVLRPRRGGTLVAIFTVLALGLLAEGILRSKGFGPSAVLYTPDARAGYYPTPNQRVDRYGGLVDVNNFGMRAPSFTVDKPAGAFRILMLGDSTLWGGSYVDQKDLYARILDRKLNEAAGGGKVEVLNMGVNGWGPFHERGWVEANGTLGADLAIVCMPHDDVERDKYTLMSLPFFGVGRAPRLALEEVMMHTMWRFRRDRIAPDAAWRAKQSELGILEYERLGVFLQSGPAPTDILDPPPRTPIGGAEVFFEVLPSRVVGMGEPIPEIDGYVVGKLTKLLGAHGIPVHFPVGLFVGKGKANVLYHDLEHLDTPGHALYAEFLFERITKDSARFGQWIKERQATRAP